MFVYFVIGLLVGLVAGNHPWKPEAPPSPPIQYTAPAPAPSTPAPLKP